MIAALTSGRIRRSGRTRPRILLALAVAAILATVAAVPAVVWFEGWNRPFDHLWEISMPVDQTVTADGYRVTVHRAYADRLGVRLAITVDDLDDRWSEFYVEDAEVTDADGRVYEGWNGSGSRTPVEGSTATWARFLIPDDAPGDRLELRVTVTSLAVRLPEPIPEGLDPEQIWTSVGGAWSFELGVPITVGQAVSPAAEPAGGSGITIDLKELGVVPSGTVVRLAVEGLPDVPGSLYGWLPSTTIEHDGAPLSGDPFEPGIGSDGVVTIEALPDVEDPAGHWRITVNGFYAFDRTLGESREIQGRWVLEFDVAETP
ncbi:MAG: hypothetical protein AB1736_05385 [Chloroflexota bacterium]